MKLELNTNGAWRTVLRGLSNNLQPEQLAEAKQAAATLARIDAATNRRPQSWRLVSEADDKVIERCTGDDGWVQASAMEYAR
jgi:hypothetical protein